MAAHEAVNPNQLKMFMTPKEITQHYAPLEGDIGEVDVNTSSMGGEYRQETHEEVWQRKSSEAQLSPRDYHELHSGQSFKTPEMNYESLSERSSYPHPPSTDRTSAWESWEPKEESYFNRKAEEHQAHWDREMGGQSIWGSIRQEGVRKPVHLGTQFGYSGKPEVVGGHHRIASARDTRPSGLIPVLHHTDIGEARPLHPAAKELYEKQARGKPGEDPRKAPTREHAREKLRKHAHAELVNKAFPYS